MAGERSRSANQLLLVCSGGQSVLTELLTEAVYSASRVNILLLAGVEGVASAADLDPDLRHRASSREGVPATAGDLALHVLGMNVCFHCSVSIAPKSVVVLVFVSPGRRPERAPKPLMVLMISLLASLRARESIREGKPPQGFSARRLLRVSELGL